MHPGKKKIFIISALKRVKSTENVECLWAYKGVVALWQDNSLLQAAHHDPPQLLEHSLQYSLLTYGGEQCEPANTCKHT